MCNFGATFQRGVSFVAKSPQSVTQSTVRFTPTEVDIARKKVMTQTVEEELEQEDKFLQEEGNAESEDEEALD